MADLAPLTLVRAPAWQALTRRLSAAVERAPRLGPARDSILRPVELLRIMAADAPGALADDVLRGDRLRAMLFLAWPYASVADEARELLAHGALATTAAAALEGSEPQPYEPGVIDHAALLVVMLAATRVADPPFAPVFVAAVHGLALAASAAEVLGRLDPLQPDASALEFVIETLYVVEAARTVTRNELLRPFALDPVERGRWHCLDHLLATGPLARSAVTTYAGWDGATSDEILRVQPHAIAAGDLIAVTVKRTAGAADPLTDAKVIFASADGEPLVAQAAVLETQATETTRELAVVVPEGAATGWIGFSRAPLIERSNAVRAALRKQLATELADACVEGERRVDPLRAIPAYGELAIPRRRGLNRVEGGAPAVTFASLTPARVAPGAAFALTWETSGADAVAIEGGGALVIEHGEPAARIALIAGADDGDVDYVITPLRAGDRGAPHTVALRIASSIAITGVQVTQGGRAAPLFQGRALDVVARLDAPRAQLDGQLFLDDAEAAPVASGPRRAGVVAFTIPAEAVRDRMSITIVVIDATGARVSLRHGPIAVAGVSRVPVVLARPLVLDREERRIELEEATFVLRDAAGELGLDLDIIDLPWSDDELAVLVQQPTGDRDPSLTRLLEALAHRALITPGFEDALWLVLLPRDHAHDRGIARWAPGYAARALAVAGPTAVARLLADVFATQATIAPPGRYLALHGTIAGQDVQVTESRVDDRRAGPSAPSRTEVQLVTLDDEGRELARQFVHVLSELRPAKLDVLIPLFGNIAAIEVRGPRGTLATLGRARGNLTIEVTTGKTESPPSSLAWRWTHDRNARPSVSLLLRRGALATPVLVVDPCASTAELPLWRYAAADGLALYATDGWNAAEQDVYSGALDRDLTAVVRRLSDGRFYADVPPDATVTWLLDGAPRGTGARTLTLQPDDTGELAVEARRGTLVVRDHRPVGAGEGL